ncbi:MAG: hypothetical protein HQL37_00640 [Alphaproteobacteria bacterium]|nr:hypothetical protein [Alphaproteobacteria bacterium]
MRETTLTAVAPPVQIALTHRLSGNGDRETVTLQVSAASVFTALASMYQPWLGWMSASPFRPWVQMIEAWRTPLMAITDPTLFAVTLMSRKNPIAADGFPDNPDSGVVVDGVCRRLD